MGLCLFPIPAQRRPYAADTRLRIFSVCFSFILPRAIASITTSARLHLSRIFARPRMKCRSNPKDTSSRLFTLSTEVRFL